MAAGGPEGIEKRLRRAEEGRRDLQAALERRDQRLERLTQQLTEQNEALEHLRQEALGWQQQLSTILGSRSWRLVDRMWRTRLWLWRVLNGNSAASGAAAALVAPPAPPARERWPRDLAALQPPASADSAGRASYDVVCFAIIDWDFRWQRPQQITSEFAERGHRVFFVSPHRFESPAQAPYALRELRPNVWEVALARTAPMDPYAGSIPAGVEDDLLSSLAALRADQRIDEAISFVQVATWASVARRARNRFGWRVAYDCMDEWSGYPKLGLAIESTERRLVAEADLLVVSARKLWEKWSGSNPNTLLARNAADFARFGAPVSGRLLEAMSPPIVGYFGAIAEWFDVDLLTAVARRRPAYNFVLLGEVFDVSIEPLRALRNVHWLDQQPYALMPGYLARFDVCLIPFKLNQITAATDPVKFYEYLSQGKPVVATSLPEIAEHGDLYYPADGEEEFARQLDRAVEERDPALRERRIAFARHNTWRERLDRIEEAVERAHPLVSVVMVSYNTAGHAALCLQSLLAHTAYPRLEVIAVDNASTDGTLAVLRAFAQRHAEVAVLSTERNVGFAHALNAGLAASRGERLVVLNADVVVPSGWLPRLLRHLDDPSVGLVVAATNFTGNEAWVDADYADAAGLNAFAARRFADHEGRAFDLRVAALYCVALRRQTFEELGPLDERYTVGMFEDDDYSERARRAGYRVVCAEDAFVHHFGQGSFKELSAAEYQAVWDRNLRWFEEKWGLRWQPHRRRI